MTGKEQGRLFGLIALIELLASGVMLWLLGISKPVMLVVVILWVLAGYSLYCRYRIKT